MTKFFSWHWDIAGFGASLLCAIHCMLMPLVLALGMFAGAHWLMNPITDWIFIGTSAVIASWSLLQSYFRKHRNLRPLWISGMGFLGLIAAQKLSVSHSHWLMAAGGGFVAYAHFHNWQLAHRPQTRQTASQWRLLTGRIVALIWVLGILLGLRSLYIQKRTPPNREDLLQIVWRMQ
ncbi:MAG: MerC domain-containing protein [Haliscomenobacter sp.]|nr:MerC domain-containing protein [Haliscomenobacter sp.]MBK8655466.1 MerC domain-containing protein [Haliscomenobacter sp.]